MDNMNVPRSVAMVIPIDPNEQTMIMLRGPNVRSAPNCWSFPSGLHDHGESLEDCARRELEEEYGLRAERLVQCGFYENQPGDGWHWVIHVFMASVADVTKAVNKEPDKHPEMRFDHFSSLLNPRFWDCFHPSMNEWGRRNRGLLTDVAMEMFEHV